MVAQDVRLTNHTEAQFDLHGGSSAHNPLTSLDLLTSLVGVESKESSGSGPRIPESPSKDRLIHFTTTMSTVRSYLNTKRQYIPTVLLLICVIFYLPYSYVSVIRAKNENIQAQLSVQGFRKIPNRSHVVFSAYLDSRFPGESAKIRIFGFKRKTDSRPLYCKLYFPGNRATCIQDPAIELVIDDEKSAHADVQCLFHCAIPEEVTEVPIAVTLASSITCQSRDHVVPVQLLQGHDPDLKNDVAVCFSTPSREFSKANEKEIVEIIELSKHFGSSSIQMYNESIRPELLQALSPYVKSGLLHLLPWRPGDRFLPGMTQALLVNDCIYRNMARYKYVVFVDKNEIIVPAKTFNASWPILMTELTRQNPAAGAFWFQDTRHAPASALPNGITAKPVAADCPLGSMPANQLPRIYTHRFISPSSKAQYHSQFIIDPSVVLHIDSKKRVKFLPGKSSKNVSREYGVGVHFLTPDQVSDPYIRESFRAPELLQVLKAVYPRLGYDGALNLERCA